MGIFDKLKRKKTKSTEEKPQEKVVKSDIPKVSKIVTKVKESKVKKSVRKGTYPDAYHVLLEPIITEKSLALQAKGKYSFYVSKNANKHKVKMAIQSVYGVRPVKINIVKQQPTTLYRWGRKAGIRKASKKAIVTVPEGTTLSLSD